MILPLPFPAQTEALLSMCLLASEIVNPSPLPVHEEDRWRFCGPAVALEQARYFYHAANFLQDRADLYPTQYAELQELAAELRRMGSDWRALVDVWEWDDRSEARSWTPERVAEGRRESLKALRERIGPAAYARGEMPRPPAWWIAGGWRKDH